MTPENRISLLEDISSDNLEQEMKNNILFNLNKNLSLDELEKVQDFAKVIVKEKKRPFVENP